LLRFQRAGQSVPEGTRRQGPPSSGMLRSMEQERSAVVTGGHGGIGRECTRTLRAAGVHVVVGARDVARAKRELGELVRTSVEVLALDLASLASVRSFSESVGASASRRPPLHAVVCNAGVQIMGPPERTADGFEKTFGVNQSWPLSPAPSHDSSSGPPRSNRSRGKRNA